MKKIKKIMDDRFKQVYCTDCVYGLGLYNYLTNNKPIPESCHTCFPYNPEDSVEKIKRKHYKEMSKEHIIE